jgi:hypothetical protein
MAHWRPYRRQQPGRAEGGGTHEMSQIRLIEDAVPAHAGSAACERRRDPPVLAPGAGPVDAAAVRAATRPTKPIQETSEYHGPASLHEASPSAAGAGPVSWGAHWWLR